MMANKNKNKNRKNNKNIPSVPEQALNPIPEPPEPTKQSNSPAIVPSTIKLTDEATLLQALEILNDFIYDEEKVPKITKKRTDYTQKELLDIYYKKPEECDHIWIEEDDELNNKLLEKCRKQLLQFSQNKKSVVVCHIDNTGGLVNTLVGIYHLLLVYPKPVITVTEYYAASSAAMIFLAGDLRIFKPYVFFLLHQQSGHTGYHSHKQLRREVYYSQLVYDKIIKAILSERTKLSEPEIKDILRQDIYLTPKFCLQKKIADHVFLPKMIKKKEFGTNIVEINMEKFYSMIKIFLIPNFYKIYKIKEIVLYAYPIDNQFLEKSSYSLTIINLLVQIPVKTTLYSPNGLRDGMIFIGLFTDECIMAKNAICSFAEIKKELFKASTGGTESANSSYQNLEFHRNVLKDILKTKTKLPRKTISEISHKIFDFTAEQALEYGLVDKLI